MLVGDRCRADDFRVNVVRKFENLLCLGARFANYRFSQARDDVLAKNAHALSRFRKAFHRFESLAGVRTENVFDKFGYFGRIRRAEYL